MNGKPTVRRRGYRQMIGNIFHRAHAGDDKYLIVIEVEDPKFDDEETESLLKGLGGKSITMIREPIE